MNQKAFQEACEKFSGGVEPCGGIVNIQRSIVHAQRSIVNVQRSIGTLGEKTLHAVLKRYLEPDEACHEIKVASFVADIVTDGGIIEIQTRAFDRLRKKLACFLEHSEVTVVYPIPKTKWLLWIDEETGQTTKKRKSPKQGSIYDVVPELTKIEQLLCHPNFRLCLLFIDMEEYRFLNGWSKDKKKGSTRCNRIPVALVEEVFIRNTAEYIKFVPVGLKEPFTSKDYQKAAKIRLRTAQTALRILHHLQILKRVGKQGNSHLYERS